MKTFLFLSACCTIPIFSCYAQNSARFHHKLTQRLIDSAGFELSRRSGTGANAKTDVMKLPTGKTVRGIVTADKGVLVLDLWQILDSETDEATKLSVFRFIARQRQLDSKTDKATKPIPATLVGKVPDLSSAKPPKPGQAYTKDQFGTDKDPTSNTVNAWTPLAGSTLVLDEKRAVLGNPTKVIRIPFSALTWGISTTPFRYRFASGSSGSTLSSNLSVSVSYGYTFGKTLFTSRLTRHNANTVAIFLGLSSAELKKTTVKDPVLWVKEGRNDKTNGAISYGLSYTRSINNVGLVISTGLDTAFGPLSSRWSYQNKLWVGLGVSTGLGFFK